MSEHLKLALEACPFCGGEAEIDIGLVSFVDATVSCIGCQALGPTIGTESGTEASNRAEAIAHWNRRASAIEGRTVTDEVRSHIAWLKTYIALTSDNNWRDMKDRVAWQLRQLESAIAMQPPQPTTGE